MTLAAGSDPILDPHRLAAVLRTRLVDTAAEPAFDDLTRMAATLVRAPLAFATIVDDTHSFWKSGFGLEPGAASRNTVDESFCQYVVRTKRELIVTDAATDPITHANPSVVSMGVRAWLGFPLVAPDGEVLGSFCAVDTTPRAWSAQDLDVMRTFAAAASREVALRDALRTAVDERDRAESIARALQVSLLPPVAPAIPGLDVAARFHSAGRGTDLVGDFYDVFGSRDGAWHLLLGDVAGKGIGAAKLAAFARNTVSAISIFASSPVQTLERLNATLFAHSPSPERFLSAVYATLDLEPARCRVRLARAGHPPPILRRAGGAVETIEPNGQLAGLFETIELQEAAFTLEPGDLLVMYTDGVDEARLGPGAPILGAEALVEIVRATLPAESSETIARRIEAATLDHSGGTASDDVAILVVRLPLATAPRA